MSNEIYTVEEIEPGIFQSVFPSRYAEHSATFTTRASAWMHIFDTVEALEGLPKGVITTEISSIGILGMVEPELPEGLIRRVFRSMPDGSYEWTSYDDWRKNGSMCRWYAYANRELPSSMRAE